MGCNRHHHLRQRELLVVVQPLQHRHHKLHRPASMTVTCWQHGVVICTTATVLVLTAAFTAYYAQSAASMSSLGHGHHCQKCM